MKAFKLKTEITFHVPDDWESGIDEGVEGIGFPDLENAMTEFLHHGLITIPGHEGCRIEVAITGLEESQIECEVQP
jgi:hypothetical protein